MRIGMILDNEFSGDMRVENEVISLRQAGFEVFILCLNHGKKLQYEDFHGAKIIRIPIKEWWKKKMKGLTNTIVDPYTFFWSRKIKSFVEDNKIDIIHVHDLYLVGAALKAKNILRDPIKIVADLHENYPEALKHYKFTKTFPGKFLISIPKWEKTEIEWLKKVDFVITVIEEAVDRYVQLGVPKETLVVVANYVNEDEFRIDSLKEDIIKRFSNKKVISYLGAFDIHRGLETLVEAFNKVLSTNKNVELLLVGDGRNAVELQNRVKELRISKNVHFEGWQGAEKLPSYISISSICVIPHLKTEHTDNTIPHKLFHYMLLQKPVITSDCKPLKRIVEAVDSGLVFESGNAKDLAEKILVLLKDPNLCELKGQNGLRAVKEKYNWEVTSKNLINLYKKLSN